MLLALLAAIGTAGGDILSKIILDQRKFSVKKYLPFLFLFLALITLMFVPSTYSFDSAAFFSVKYILLFIFMLVAAVSWNLRFYTSIQKESLHEFELIILLTPITTVILAAIFYPDERNFSYFMAALVASIALVASRIKRDELHLTQNMKRSLLAMLFIAIEVVIIKQLLVVFSPTLLYFTRTLVLFLVYFFLYRPKWYDYAYDKRTTALIMLAGVAGVMNMVFKFYGYEQLGIVKTTLILLLAPILTYAASYFYFKEHRLFKRDLAAAVVIILCVAYVTLIK